MPLVIVLMITLLIAQLVTVLMIRNVTVPVSSWFIGTSACFCMAAYWLSG